MISAGFGTGETIMLISKLDGGGSPGGSRRTRIVISGMVCSLVLRGSPNLVRCQTPPPVQEVYFDNDGIVLPVGVYMLIRKDGKIGAVRYTSITLGPTGAIGKVTYESLFQGDGSLSLDKPNVIRRTGLLDIRQLSGVGDFAFQMGDTTLHVGPWKFDSLAPGRVEMPADFWGKDKGFEFAPTSASSQREINASAPGLRWLKASADSHLSLPVSKLAK